VLQSVLGIYVFINKLIFFKQNKILDTLVKNILIWY
jgi:hypothetical protein